ncbi:Lysophospholipase L1 [Chitinophaga sp. YR573]|uniref:GDSL-type esterase/lipase family protein n=1 Tax=Chitinophaga sp. YR573 TaxID=1881040 RepID=UPI0008BBFD7B|nr:GDSL-type esterase/lipase family protein [Chitinophaga sp. YR573]SEW28666.1 Lysophospholipase L1 [Chitinophaga sp. YR573]
MKKLLFFVFLIIAGETLSAQNKQAYREDVQTIRKYDQMYEPPYQPILFIGSSSIRKWNDLERTFADYVVLNRGIGGAVVNDITYYLNDIVFPYHPRQIVIYVGENDLPDEQSTADSVLNRTKRLIEGIRAKLPEISILYISIKPSPSREKYQPKAIAANELIREYLKEDKNITFIDVFSLMLTPEGKLRPELFVGDMLHMNGQGYKIWRAAVEPYLLKRS